MTTITYTRIDEGTYSVLVDGMIVGQVYKAWSRVGGWGWVSRPGDLTYLTPTRKSAAALLIRRTSA